MRLLLPKEAYLQRVDANWRMMSPQGLEPPFAGQIALAVKIATFAMLHRTGLGFALDDTTFPGERKRGTLLRLALGWLPATSVRLDGWAYCSLTACQSVYIWSWRWGVQHICDL